MAKRAKSPNKDSGNLAEQELRIGPGPSRSELIAASRRLRNNAIATLGPVL